MGKTGLIPERVKVLDHGYVLVVESWGSDSGIIEAARMSTQRGFEGWGKVETCARCKGSGTNEPENGPGSLCKVCEGRKVAVNVPGDEKLLAYLWKNNHATPFEMAGLIVEVQAPIFVFREWQRHRTQSYNEMSARYAPLPDLNYVPTIERIMLGGGHLTKQAGSVEGAAALTAEGAQAFQNRLRQHYDDLETEYQRSLSNGVSKELARLILPVGRYSRMRAQTNLRNWLSFLTLRDDAKAQWEIRQYAAVVRVELEKRFPRTLALFNEGRR